jgi:UDP-N-acetylmuramate dehydrogenase
MSATPMLARCAPAWSPALLGGLRDLGVPFREHEPLARHTSMGVGGPARVMAFPRSPEELRATLRLRAALGVPQRVLGGGSNLVVVDEGLDELVINTEALQQVELLEHGRVRAQGGANLIRTVVRCCRAGLAGLQSAVGIPGSVGGAAVMNAGAYGFSISDVMTDIVVYDERGERMQPPEGWRFHYRGSSIPEGAVVAQLEVQLSAGEPERLGREIRELQLQRVRSQPTGRNAGCVFKNPAGAHAGKLIDDLGLKGTRIGGALVSPRHANFVVNDAGASAQDVLALLELVRERVAREAGVELELEVKVWRPRP